ncbi:anti-sigma factor [Neorhizobium alkalisoli]|jgi:anti-sigma-K factor RskA|uniref:Anti-sigma-K factor RskA n=1 Tax=Neorhizobium alkalisoli TaxID=528178 RepID=A0A561R795_9HYPH|nr:anti-sigma factor [Neorhizobium alkalisoli]TWF58466.1 anti-sigma-K factor RskA [Neorhizobium alkalisoli]
MSASEQSHGGGARDEVLAGEYVLGVLPAEARRRVEDRMATDRAFARIVQRWESDLSSMNEEYEPVTPPARVFADIQTRLFGAEQAPAPGLWNSAAFWRWISTATSAMAVLAILFGSGLFNLNRIAATPPLVAKLSGPNAQVDLLASYDQQSGRLQVVPVAAGPARNKSLELWVVPASGNPLSLGIMPSDFDGDMVIPADLRSRIGEGATLAVTLEPFGGSPSGLPTGPIVASGATQKL